MRVGMIGTGAISHKHAQAYKNIGFQLTVCTDIFEAAGRRFADQYGAEFVPTYEEECRHPKADILLGVVSQHRFDDSSMFLAKAIAGGRLGKLLEADCYVKWYRSPEYYSRPI